MTLEHHHSRHPLRHQRPQRISASTHKISPLNSSAYLRPPHPPEVRAEMHFALNLPLSTVNLPTPFTHSFSYPLSFQSIARSFATRKMLSSFLSIVSALFAKNTGGRGSSRQAGDSRGRCHLLSPLLATHSSKTGEGGPFQLATAAPNSLN